MSLEPSSNAASENTVPPPPSPPPPPPPAAPAQPSLAAERVKAASRDALAALKGIATNPMGGIQPAYSALGDARALGVGLAFGVVSVLCFLLGGYLLLPSFIRGDLFDFLGFGGVMKCLLFALMPFVGTAAGSLAARKILHGAGGYGADCFVAGVALLPSSLAVLLSGIFGGNYQILAVFSVFAGCLGVLMLFSGYTRILNVSERAATLAVPIVILLTMFLTKTLASSVISGGVNNYSFGATPRLPAAAAASVSGGTLSGTYEARGPDGTTISLNFRKNGNVQMKMSGGGSNESDEGTYEVYGNMVTVSATGEGMGMTLIRDGNTLTADFGGMSLRFTKR